jgi:hypothetical protein
VELGDGEGPLLSLALQRSARCSGSKLHGENQRDTRNRGEKQGRNRVFTNFTNRVFTNCWALTKSTAIRLLQVHALTAALPESTLPAEPWPWQSQLGFSCETSAGVDSSARAGIARCSSQSRPRFPLQRRR